MGNKLSQVLALPSNHPQQTAVGVVGFATILSIWLSIWLEQPVIAALPLGLILLWVTIVDFPKLFFALFFFIPLSIEQELPGGFGTDLPTEPLMWVLTTAFGAYCLLHWKEMNKRFLYHPVTVLLIVHLAWIAITTIVSEQFIFSLKFFLAKMWYVIVFFFLAGKLLKTEQDVRKLVNMVLFPLLFTIIFVSYKHAQFGFSFEESNHVMSPFYRNHVVYACLPAIFIPYLWFGMKWYERRSFMWYTYVFGIFACIFAVNFAFTRAAYIALLAAIVVNYIIRWRLIRQSIALVVLLFSIFIGVITTKDHYLEFAPDFSRTITHKRFENLLEATTKLEDISTMERVYRWVSASFMIEKHPYLGYGPGNFYSFYQKYTVSSFKTYVSDNIEKSGIHCYFLMVTVEQGVPGFVIFICMVFLTLIIAERAYHATADLAKKRILIAAAQSFFMINLLMLMNDFVETDKIGSFFFVAMAIIINQTTTSTISTRKT